MRSALFTTLALVIFLQAQPAAAQNLIKGLPNAQTPSACRAGLRVYESDRGRQLLGEVVEADFLSHLPDWNHEFTSYEPAPLDIAVLAAVEDKIDIICVLGTWCHDSEREVPRFWKILKTADNPNLDLTMFAAGRSSDEEATTLLENIGFDVSLRETYSVELVPTFIFMADGVELGRIIETPETTLEQDAAQILKSEAPREKSWN
ncbi:MAG: hypothetical protein GY780_07810 [bacterium]|nr:hypothetical protein [bacterium]